MRPIGLHLRLTDSLLTLAHRAIRLELLFFQCFLVLQETGRLYRPTKDEVKQFREFCSEHFKMLFIHGSYWINLAGIVYNGRRAFDRELALAKELGFTHMILHPGSAKGARGKREGIDALARELNDIFSKEQSMTIVLENTVHAGMTVGSDIEDFGVLLEKLDRPEQIKFCLDTSHAYAYGYDIISSQGQKDFFALIDRVIGHENVVLLHLNDSHHVRGSRIDKHAVPGKGNIGIKPLQSFVLHSSLKDVPLLIEPPVLDDQEEKELINSVRAWHE